MLHTPPLRRQRSRPGAWTRPVSLDRKSARRLDTGSRGLDSLEGHGRVSGSSVEQHEERNLIELLIGEFAIEDTSFDLNFDQVVAAQHRARADHEQAPVTYRQPWARPDLGE